MALDDLNKKFIALFGRQPELIVNSPGRVNLIGEHTDYSDLPRLPGATGAKRSPFLQHQRSFVSANRRPAPHRVWKKTSRAVCHDIQEFRARTLAPPGIQRQIEAA